MVEVLVDERGRVSEKRIIDRFLYGKRDDPPEPVEHVGYGIEEAALSAAERWQFRPAKHGGRTVRSYYTLTFRFGV
jgi:protein TonB